MINSTVIEYENSRNPFLERKEWINSYLTKSIEYQRVNAKIQKRAEHINKNNIEPIDSLHLAAAEATKTEFFITCDDDILKKYKGDLKTLNPIDFIQLWETQ